MVLLRFVIQVLILLLHTAILVVAGAVPLTLAVQTVRLDGTWSLAAWRAAFASDQLHRWAELLGHTVIIGVLAVAVAVGGGCGLALWAVKLRWRGRAALTGLLVVAACLPLYVTHATLLGAIDTLAPFGVTRTLLTGSLAAAGILHGLLYVPLAAVLIGIGLLGVEPELEEAAVLRTSTWRTVWGIVRPRAAWSVGVAGAIVLWLTVTDYAITDVLQVRCFAEEIYTQYALEGARTRPLIIALPMAAVLAAGFLGVARLARGGARRLYAVGRGPFQLPGSPGTTGVGVALLAIGGVIGAAAVVIMGRRLAAVAEPAERFAAIVPEWLTTVGVALAVGGGLAVVAPHVAWMGLRSRWLRWPVAVTLLGLVAVPAPALAMTVLYWVTRPVPHAVVDWCAARGFSIAPVDALIEALYNSPAMYVLTIGLRFLPLAVVVVAPAVWRVPLEEEDAARLHGARWSDLLLRVYWPQCRDRAILAGVIVMILVIGELDCAHLVAPPGPPLLSVRLFTFIHNGVDADVVAVCAVATLTTLPLAWVVWRVLESRVGRGR